MWMSLCEESTDFGSCYNVVIFKEEEREEEKATLGDGYNAVCCVRCHCMRKEFILCKPL